MNATSPQPRAPAAAPALGQAPVYRFIDGAIEIFRHDVPSPWINYLSNGRFHAFVSQAGGGFCWWKSPLIFRLTRYRMHHLPIDSPGFHVYLRESDGCVWSPTWRPCALAPERWSATHRPGSTTFTAARQGLEAELTLFVAPRHDALIWDLRLRNMTRDDRVVDAFAYAELSQLQWAPEQFYGRYLRHKLNTWYDPQRKAIFYLFHHEGHPRLQDVPLVYFTATRDADAFSGDRDAFMGPYRDERMPAGVERGWLGNESLSAGEPCAALQHKLTMTPGRNLRLTYFLGVAPGALADYGRALEQGDVSMAALRAEGAVDEERHRLDAWWRGHLEAFSCRLPDETAQRQVALWSPVNSVQTARYSRAVSPIAPGGRGLGFRDTCQDMLAIAYRDPAWAEGTLLNLLKLQFRDGNVVHVAHPEETEPPDPTPHSDNHLWLPLLAHAIAAETGNPEFLSRRLPFLDGGEASAWEHLLRAVRFTEAHLGAHRLPLILHGDWNDAIGRFARRGLGESVFAGQQYVYALRLTIALAGTHGDRKSAEWLQDCLRRQEEALLACAWDGQWWRRGFDDDGVAFGSTANAFGQIFLNPQSWAVLADVGTAEQQAAGMRAVAERLDTGIGLRLLAPGFKTWPEVKDPFSGFGPGSGENAGIFCHANTWAIIAEALLGHGERAWKYFAQTIPHNVIAKVGIERYAAEPYAWVSNIVGPEGPRFGWGNVSHITGTAAWMDVAATAYLLGVRAELDGLRLAPCIPAAWDGFSVTRRFRGTWLDIEVANPQHVETGVREIRLDGRPVDLAGRTTLPGAMLSGRRRVSVNVTMGCREPIPGADPGHEKGGWAG